VSTLLIQEREKGLKPILGGLMITICEVRLPLMGWEGGLAFVLVVIGVENLQKRVSADKALT
jgi:hypothetical protein